MTHHRRVFYATFRLNQLMAKVLAEVPSAEAVETVEAVDETVDTPVGQEATKKDSA